MTSEDIENLGKMAEDLYKLRNEMKELREDAWRLEMIIRQGMERIGAKAVLHPRFEISLKEPSPNYNDPESKLDLQTLIEEIGIEKLVALKAYDPPYTPEPVEVEGKWNGKGLLKVRDLHKDYAKLIDSARRPKRDPQVIIKEHEPVTTWHEDTGL